MQICVNDLNKVFVVKSGGFFKSKNKTVVKAVENVSFEIKKGEIVAFIGPNGAGKSTTIKMLTGIIQPTSGTINVSGLTPSKDRKKLAYKIGCMFGQKSQLYMQLTVRDSYKLLCSMYDLDKKKTEEKIEEIMQQEKPNQKEFIKIHHERIDKYIPTKIKESGKVEDFIIQCVEEHNKREKLRQERNAR